MDNSDDAASANQKRMNADPLEVTRHLCWRGGITRVDCVRVHLLLVGFQKLFFSLGANFRFWVGEELVVKKLKLDVTIVAFTWKGHHYVSEHQNKKTFYAR